MKPLSHLYVVLIFAHVAPGLASQPVVSLPRSAPEAQGVSSAGLLTFIEAADYQEWKKGRARWGASPNKPVAASGAWPTDDTFVVKLCVRETPFHATIKLRFDGDRMMRDQEVNVAFGSTKQPQLVGQAN